MAILRNELLDQKDLFANVAADMPEIRHHNVDPNANDYKQMTAVVERMNAVLAQLCDSLPEGHLSAITPYQPQLITDVSVNRPGDEPQTEKRGWINYDVEGRDSVGRRHHLSRVQLRIFSPDDGKTVSRVELTRELTEPSTIPNGTISTEWTIRLSPKTGESYYLHEVKELAGF
jgi:hypothetical protein